MFLSSWQVCVEGNIASGKTAFLEYFKKNKNVEASITMNGNPDWYSSQRYSSYQDLCRFFFVIL